MGRILLLTSLLALAAPAARAYTYGPYGCNLRWNECYADGGVQNRAFACDTNAGSELLVASFVPAWDIQQVNGLELVIDLAASSATLPEWWKFMNVGTCRQFSLSMGFQPTHVGATGCPMWGTANSGGGIGAYRIGVQDASRARIVAVVAVLESDQQNLTGRAEYFAAQFSINHAKTVGTGACGGCSVPVCVNFTSIRMTTPVAANDRWLTGPANQVDSDFVTWQGGGANCPGVVPTRKSTWGAVKSLYR